MADAAASLRVSPARPFHLLLLKAGHAQDLVREVLLASRRWWKLSAACAKSEDDAEFDAYQALRHAQFNLLWTDTRVVNVSFGPEDVFGLVPPPAQCLQPTIPSFQCVNHLPGADALLTKDNLLRTLNAAYSTSSSANGRAGTGTSPQRAAGASSAEHVFDVCPTTFLMRAGGRVEVDSPAWTEFARRYRELSAGRRALRMPSKHCTRNLWVLKPASGSNGVGVRIFSDLGVLLAALRRRQGDFLVQKYIERPLLFRGRKCSLHTWVLVTDTLDAYVWRGMYARIASRPYSLSAADGTSDTDAPGSAATERPSSASTATGSGAPGSPSRVSAADARWIHVTSTTAQEDCPEFQTVAEGNFVSLTELSAAIDESGVFARGAVTGVLLPRVRRIIADAVRGCAARLRRGCRGRRCFELMGADFVVDEDLRPWLVGFSENPSLDAPTMEHEASVRSLVDQTLRIAVDPLFPARVGETRADVSASGSGAVLPGPDGAIRWVAPPGPPTGPQAVVAAAIATQQQTIMASSSGGSPGGAAAVQPLAIDGFDLVYRVRDIPPSHSPMDDDAWAAADPALRASADAADVVSEDRMPPRALEHVPSRGLPLTEPPSRGLRVWWRAGMGLAPGQVVENAAADLAESDSASSSAAVQSASMLSPTRMIEAAAAAIDAAPASAATPASSQAATSHFSNGVQRTAPASTCRFPADPSPVLSSPRAGETRAAKHYVFGSHDPMSVPPPTVPLSSEALARINAETPGLAPPPKPLVTPQQPSATPAGVSSFSGPVHQFASPTATQRSLGSTAGGAASMGMMSSASSVAGGRSTGGGAAQDGASTVIVPVPSGAPLASQMHTARELREAANKARRLLTDLRNRAEQVAVTGTGQRVSATVLVQLEGLVQRLEGEARGAELTAQAGRRAASAGRALRVGSTATGNLDSASVVISGIASLMGSMSGRAQDSSAASVASFGGSRTPGGRPSSPTPSRARSVTTAPRPTSSHRVRLRTVTSRVDSGQVTTQPGMSTVSRRLREDLRVEARNREMLVMARGAMGGGGAIRGRAVSTPNGGGAGSSRYRDEWALTDGSPGAYRDSAGGASPHAPSFDGRSSGSRGASPSNGYEAAAIQRHMAASEFSSDDMQPRQRPAQPEPRPQPRPQQDSAASDAAPSPVRRPPPTPANATAPTSAAPAQSQIVAQPVLIAKAMAPVSVEPAQPLPSQWEVWIETPAPSAGGPASVYYYRASDRVTQWERPSGDNVLVMTRDEAARRAAAAMGRMAATA